MRKKFIVFIGLIIWGKILFSQDALFTQYQYSPLYLNPALTGGSRNNLRITGLTKMQWFNLYKPFKFINAAADISFYDNDQRNIANLGFMANHSSKGGLNNTSISGLFSRNFVESSGFAKWYLSLGLQAGYNFSSVNPNGFVFMDQLDQNGITGGMSQIDLFSTTTSKNYFDMSAGFVFNWSSFMIGAAVHHLNEPLTSFNGKSEDSKLPRKVTGHFSYLLERDFFDLKPTLIAQIQGPSTTMMLGVIVDFKEYPVSINLFYRNNIGLQYNNALSVGISWKLKKPTTVYSDYELDNDVNFGLSHDSEINKPGLNTTFGSLEFGVNKNIELMSSVCPDRNTVHFIYPWMFYQ